VKSAEFRLKNELGDYGVYQDLTSFWEALISLLGEPQAQLNER